jgi:periplasmic divalent cation tolerance protein
MPSRDAVVLTGASEIERHDMVVVLSTAPDLLLAKRIAHVLIEEYLAACVNIGAPVLSMYMWEGVMEGVDEIPLTIKTSGDRTQALAERIAQLHPYEVPEIVVMPVVGAALPYAQWVRAQTLLSPNHD